MNIQILQLIEGAKAARGLTVIIDVFRAFSVEAYLFAQRAEMIIPVGDAELAYGLKKENSQFILARERHGKILPDFAMCTDADRFDFVLKLVKPQDGMPYMTRQSV